MYLLIHLKIKTRSPLYINIIFMRVNYIFQNKKIWREEWHCLTFLQISLVSGLIEDSWILISASAQSLMV